VSSAAATARQRSATGTIRDPACTTLGGFGGLSSAGSPICYGNYVGVERLVEESDQFSLFAEFNIEFAGLEFHLEGLGYYRELPEASVLTRTGPLTFAVSGVQNGPTFSATTNPFPNQYDRSIVSLLPSFTSTGLNPAVGVFLNNHFRNSDGTTTSYSAAQIDAITNASGTQLAPGRVALLSSLWTPYGAGGNPLGENFDYQRNTTTQYRLSSSLGGGLPSFLGTELEWEVALTYHYTRDTRWTLDIPTHKLQNALNGFGGPNCTQDPTPSAVNIGAFVGTPGAPGCYFFNPFTSAVSHNLYTGAANTVTYVGSGTFNGYMPGQGLRNNPDMIRWLYEPVTLKRAYTNYVFDPIIRGSIGVELPGGEIQAAVGGQFRRQDEEVDISDNVDRSINPCPWLPNGTRLVAPVFNPSNNRFEAVPGTPTGTINACTGMMTFSKATTVLGSQANNHRDEKRHYPVAAGFLQFKLPILDNLNADIVGRYEKFFSDVTDRDNDVLVPSIALKWDISDWVSLRTSYGKTFSQVNPPADVPAVPANATINNLAYTSFNFPNLDVQPEKGTNISVGFIFSSGDFTATVDYNAITIKNYTRSITAGQIVTAALLPGEASGSASALLDCNSPLITQLIPEFGNRPYVQLNGNGVCTPGSSRLNSTTTGTTPDGFNGISGGAVNFFGGQGQVNSGELVNNALDVAMSYSFDAWGGRLVPSINGTYVTKWHLNELRVAGVKLADGYDGVGYRNQSSGRLLQGVPEYRLGFSLLYRFDRHTVNVSARYIPSVINEDSSDFNATLSRNANIGPNAATACPSVPSMTSHVGHYPAGAGTAEFGATNGGCNMTILSGAKIDSYFNLDLVYRVAVSDYVDLSLNVVNILDEDPSFARNQLGYDAGYGSPLGRTIELSATAKF
jgi:iron complex outermembrane receptor protein